MRSRPSHEFALAAAARVSCCAALVSLGCHPPASGPASTTDSELEGSDAQPPLVVEPDPYASDPALDPSARVPPVSEERLALERCQDQVSAASEAGKLGPADESCCSALVKNLYEPIIKASNLDEAAAEQQRLADNDVWWAVSSKCCPLIDDLGAACSPWGPPMPPSMFAQPGRDSELLDLRSLAHALRPAGLDEAVIDDRLRSAAIATWRARMVNEYGSAPVFEGLFAQLDALDMLEPRELERVREFAGQERRHGIACGAVVEALGGAAAAPGLPFREFPEHADAHAPLEACLRNLLSICCLSETVAVSLIAAERHDMPAGPLRELLTGIWAEECGHANFGWRVLPELLAHADSQTLAGLAEYLRLAFAELEAHELMHLPADFVMPPGGAEYGLCEGAEARELFYATVERVIVPGLEARGLPAQQAWASRAHARAA